jgi:hypothetical protein
MTIVLLLDEWTSYLTLKIAAFKIDIFRWVMDGSFQLLRRLLGLQVDGLVMGDIEQERVGSDRYGKGRIANDARWLGCLPSVLVDRVVL